MELCIHLNSSFETANTPASSWVVAVFETSLGWSQRPRPSQTTIVRVTQVCTTMKYENIDLDYLVYISLYE